MLQPSRRTPTALGHFSMACTIMLQIDYHHPLMDGQVEVWKPRGVGRAGWLGARERTGGGRGAVNSHGLMGAFFF